MALLRILICVAIWATTSSLVAQSFWFETKVNDGMPFIADRLEGAELQSAKSDVVINFHETSRLQENINLPLRKSDYSQCQIFSVYKSDKAHKEGLIWKFQSQNEDLLITTDQRTVDLTKGKFMNYVDFSPLEPQIHTYQHYRNEFAADALQLSSMPSRSDIPVTSYQGSLAEFIAFDRVLAPLAKQAVESYLALKYSIPLTLGMDYVEANGRAYWTYQKNKEYAHSVAGLGRYASLGLHQKQSISQLGDGTIALGVGTIAELNKNNPTDIVDGNYLVWSDDDKAIDFQKENAKPERLHRTWKVNTTGMVGDHLSFQLNHRGLSQDLNDDLNYWLAWDHGNEAAFSAAMTSYYPLAQEEDIFSASDIDTPTSGASFFTLIKAPKLFAAIDILEQECGSDQGGSISYKVVGGKAPYKVALQAKDGQTQQTVSQDELSVFENLEAGKHTLIVTDALGHSWSEALFINSALPIEIDLPSRLISTDEEQVLTASNSDEYYYTWVSPSGIETYDSSISIAESGTYILQVSDGNCHAWHEVKVLKNQSNILYSNVSPNPTTDGYFKFDATLKVAAPYTIAISHVSGTELMRQSYPAKKFISLQDRILSSGMFVISLITADEVRSEKLVVNL